MTEQYNSQNDLISELIKENTGLKLRIDENLARIDSLRGLKSLPSLQVDQLTTQIAPQPWIAPLYPARWARLQPQCKPGQCDSPHFPDDAA